MKVLRFHISQIINVLLELIVISDNYKIKNEVNCLTTFKFKIFVTNNYLTLYIYLWLTL